MPDHDDDDEPSTIPCWDCDRETTLREASLREVMDHDSEGIGYDVYDAYLCPACVRRRQPHHACQDCGREFTDLEAAATCCTGGMRGPI